MDNYNIKMMYQRTRIYYENYNSKEECMFVIPRV
jgi:hypothetical protein